MLEVFGHCWRGACGLDLMAAAAIACLAIFSRERRTRAKDRAFRIIGASTGVPTNAEATIGGPPWAELVLASGVGPEMPTDLSFQSLTDPDFLSRTGASLFVLPVAVLALA